MSNLLLRGAPAVAQAEGMVHEVVKARVFLLVDNNGEMRAGLAASPDGDAGLLLYDAAGEPRASLQVLPDGSPRLSLYDAAGKTRARLAVLSDSGSALLLTDAADKPRVLLDVFGGRPGLSIRDAEGNIRAVVGCTKTATKPTGAEINYPESTITLSNADGYVLWQAP